MGGGGVQSLHTNTHTHTNTLKHAHTPPPPPPPPPPQPPPPPATTNNTYKRWGLHPLEEVHQKTGTISKRKAGTSCREELWKAIVQAKAASWQKAVMDTGADGGRDMQATVVTVHGNSEERKEKDRFCLG